jgi:hypothetical protein
MKNLKPRRHQEEQGKNTDFRNYRSEQNTSGINVENEKNEMGVLYREMEDWYRGEEKRGMVEAF